MANEFAVSYDLVQPNLEVNHYFGFSPLSLACLSMSCFTSGKAEVVTPSSGPSRMNGQTGK